MMVDRIHTTTGGKLDKLTQQDKAAAINYISETVSSSRSQSNKGPKFDDLIVSLADAHENRRARQVSEWESMPRHSFRLAVQ